MRPVILFLCGALVGPVMTRAVDHDGALDELTRTLLDVPALAPDWQDALRQRIRAGWIPPPMPSRAPCDDAPISWLVRYWDSGGEDRPDRDKPSEPVRARLLDYCEQTPDDFASLCWCLDSSRTDVVERVRNLLHRLPQDSPKNVRNSIEGWLAVEAGSMPDWLERRALDAFRAPADPSEHGALRALMQRDWPAAERILSRFVNDDRDDVRGLALALMFDHANADPSNTVEIARWTGAMRAFVESRASAEARARALEVLSASEWSGRAEFLLAQFRDEALARVPRQSPSLKKSTVLWSIVESAPDFWVPHVAKLVSSTQRIERDNAIWCLTQVCADMHSDAALRTLLPWLSDPAWAVETADLGRSVVVQGLRWHELPESVPGLIAALERARPEEAPWIADALVHQGDREAVPALKRTLAKLSGQPGGRAIGQALLRLGGLTLEEQSETVIAYAKHPAAVPWRGWRQQPAFGRSTAALPTQESIGQILCHGRSSDDALAALLREKTLSLASTHPAAAKMILGFVGRWNTPTSYSLIVQRLRSGSLSEDLVQTVITNRAGLRQLLAAESGLKGGSLALRALALNDEEGIRGILAGREPQVQAFLCACARVGGIKLPVDRVGRLLDADDPLVSRAASGYLESDDSPEARAKLLGRLRGKAHILGAKGWLFEPGHGASKHLSRMEEELRRRVLAKDGPDEIHALLSTGAWGSDGQCIVEMKHGRALFTFNPGGGRGVPRNLDEKETKALLGFLREHDIADLPPLNQHCFDGTQFEYLRISKDGGRRVFMDNPGIGRFDAPRPKDLPPRLRPDPDDAVYMALIDTFQRLIKDTGAAPPTW